MAGSTRNDKRARKHTVKAELRIVERFLQEWDSIGAIRDQVEDGVQPTEYYTYAPVILGMLSRGCSAKALAEHLASARTKRMGLGRDDANDARIAKGLVRWWKEFAPHTGAG